MKVLHERGAQRSWLLEVHNWGDVHPSHKPVARNVAHDHGNPPPHDVIANLTAAEPGLWRDFAILGCTHQRLMMRHSQRLRKQAAIVRLAGFLLGKAVLSPNALIPMTQEALADVVGVSRQRINVLLKDLSKLGFTRLAYGAVEVSDIGGLREFIDRHQ